MRAFVAARTASPSKSLRANLHVGNAARARFRFLALVAWAAPLLLCVAVARAQDSPSDSAAVEVAADPGPPIAQVEVSGNQRIEPSAILPLLVTKPGEPVDPQKIRQDIQTLWRQGFFSDIDVDVSPSPRGPVVTFIVVEKPLVDAVKVEGNTEIDSDDLKKLLLVKPFQILDLERVHKTVRKLEDKYADKGFYLADVTSRIVPAPGRNQVDVFFDVVEHAKVEVRRITFEGNHALTSDELKSALGTREGSLLSFLTGAGTYKQEVFQRDLLIIQSLYYNKGYINVRVGHPAVSLSADKKYIYINIPISEGEPYDFGKVGVSGKLLGQGQQVRPLLAMHQGERFSSRLLQKTLLAIQDHYRDQGYAYVQVTPQTGVNVQAKSVDLDFVVDPGKKVMIERIDIVGNTKTRDLVIRRQLTISEGDIYSGQAIRESKARVTALGYFDSVDISSRQGSRPDTMILTVRVKEKATGTFQVGLGFSNQEPILLNANVSENNLLGWGVDGALMAQLSNLRRIFSLSYTDPYFLDTRWTLAFDLYNTLEIYGNLFDRSALGGDITGGYELFHDFRVFATYTLQWVDVVATSSGIVPFAGAFTGGRTSSFKLSFNYDKRNNRLFPSAGFLLSGSGEFAEPFFGSQNLFERYVGIFRYYLPLPFGIVAKLNSTVGWIHAGGATPVPLSERFFEGGIDSLRGYDYRTISPELPAGKLQPNEPTQTVLVGGDKELLTNWELEFPLLEEAGLRGVVFFDAGNVYSEQQTLLDPSAPGKFGLLMSVGVGVRWFTPLGPLRFEWGFPLTRRPIDQPSRFDFTIGNFF